MHSPHPHSGNVRDMVHLEPPVDAYVGHLFILNPPCEHVTHTPYTCTFYILILLGRCSHRCPVVVALRGGSSRAAGELFVSSWEAPGVTSPQVESACSTPDGHRIASLANISITLSGRGGSFFFVGFFFAIALGLVLLNAFNIIIQYFAATLDT